MASWLWFGAYKVSHSQVFFRSVSCCAFVNIKPVVPGHCLVCPYRRVQRISQLTKDEVSDLWLSVQAIGSKLETHFGACALSLVIQDGKDAGQTVPHVHVHIIPRKPGDFKRNDDIYDELEDVTREHRTAARSLEVMTEEALTLATYFPDNQNFIIPEPGTQ